MPSELGDSMRNMSSRFRRLSDRTGAKRPHMRPQVVEGVLRQGHKMMVVGPSKLGKSWNCIALAYACANGTEWMGHPCRAGEVCLVDGEMDPASFDNRCDRVARALWPDDDDEAIRMRGANISVISLRGTYTGVDGLVDELRAYYGDEPPMIVIIDPIYKLLVGDENSNSDMRDFQLGLDRIAAWRLGGDGDAPDVPGPSVAFSHHSAKGDVGARSVEDSGSGAGVFGRDPDAIVRMAPLDVPEESDMFSALMAHYGSSDDPREAALAAKVVRTRFSLREFASPDPVDMAFEFPLFVPVSGLEGAHEAGSVAAGRERGAIANRVMADERWATIDRLVAEAVDACGRKRVTPTRRSVYRELERVCAEADVPCPSEGKFKNETKPGGRSAWVANRESPYELRMR